MSRKKDLPGWFPFALLASGMLAIGAGIKSGWKTSPQQPQPPGTVRGGYGALS